MRSRWETLLLAAALFVTALAARLWLIHRYATPLPFLDQWDAEAASLLKPWLEGNLRFADLLRPHNEHRILLSRLLVLALTWLNGQWDSLVQMVVNAALCAFIAVTVATAAARLFGGRFRMIIFAATAVWAALPYSQENTLWGFQSAFYFLLFFSLVAIWNLGWKKPFSLSWSAGVVAAILACLSMASGLLAPAAVVALLVLRSLRERRMPPGTLVTGCACLLIISVAIYFSADVPRHEHLKAQSVGTWLYAFSRCLAWPVADYPAAAVLLNAPVILLAIQYLRSYGFADSKRLKRQAEVILTLSFWVVLQAAAMAYARAAEANLPASRYLDILALGTLANFLACLSLVSILAPKHSPRGAVVGAAGLWTAGTLAALSWSSYEIIRAQATRPSYLRGVEANLRGYMQTRQDSYLARELPYPNAVRLKSLLDDPAIRRILPAQIREPLRVEKAMATGTAFRPAGVPGKILAGADDDVWGSFSAEGAAARGSMRSQALRSHFPFLRIETAGSRKRGMSLKLQTPDQQRASNVNASRRLDRHWHIGTVSTPGEWFELVARDDSAKAWLGFRSPREIGRLSVYAEEVVRRGKWAFITGSFLWALPLVLLLLDRVFRKTATA